jgi:hypothetical protein
VTPCGIFSHRTFAEITVMKKFLIPALTIVAALIISCNSSDKKHEGHKKEEPKTQEDSLMANILEGHDIGMAKINKLHAAQTEVKRLIDSVGKLPAPSKTAAAGYLEQLNKALEDLNYADFAMDKWMTEFDMDSAKNNPEARIKYLLDEQMKVDKMKNAILNSMQKADSLFKVKP